MTFPSINSREGNYERGPLKSQFDQDDLTQLTFEKNF